MSRYWQPIDLKDFKNIVHTYELLSSGGERYINCDYDYKRLTPKIEKDLSKVQFDTENISSKKEKGTKLFGYNTLPNGMVYLGVWAGGDWETPVYFILYWDGKELRGYIPKDGNTWNTDTNMAYGTYAYREADLQNCKKRWPELFAEEIEGYEILPPDFDQELIFNDIMKRIKKKS